jgi:hypothetical protein
VPITIATLVMAVGSLFNVQTVPIENPDALAFLAHGRSTFVPDVFVLDGFDLLMYGAERESQTVRIRLGDATSVFDVADIDEDGQGEVIAVQGDRIVAYELLGGNLSEAPRELFRLMTQLSKPAPRPQRHVLAVRRENTMVLGLPCEDTFQWRTLEGKLVASYPIGDEAPRRVSYGRPFSAVTVQPFEMGNRDDIEMRVARLLEFEPDLPDIVLPIEERGPMYRRATSTQSREAADLDAAYWPWFPLALDGSTDKRVLYASAGPEFNDTLIQIQKTETDRTSPGNIGVVTSAERRYPGTLMVNCDTLPDFNGDGFADIVLWKTPDPGVTVDSLTRALCGGSWPLHITVHLYWDKKGHYEPAPAGHVTCRVPIGWFFSMSDGTPLRHVIQRDFDGDGRTDLGFSDDTSRFSVWLWREGGFPPEPDDVRTFPQPIEGIEFCDDLEGGGRLSLGVRTSKALYVLRARPVVAPRPAR